MKVSEYERLKIALLREFENRTPDTASLSARRALDDLERAAAGQSVFFKDEVNGTRQYAFEMLAQHASNDARWKETGDPELGEDLRWRANVDFLVAMLGCTLRLEPDTPPRRKELPMEGRRATPAERRERFAILPNDSPSGVD